MMYINNHVWTVIIVSKLWFVRVVYLLIFWFISNQIHEALLMISVLLIQIFLLFVIISVLLTIIFILNEFVFIIIAAVLTTVFV